jgi:hypothetical protein
VPRLRDDPGRIVLAVDVPREQADRLTQIATREHRTTRAQLRVLIERCLAEYADQLDQAA